MVPVIATVKFEVTVFEFKWCPIRLCGLWSGWSTAASNAAVSVTATAGVPTSNESCNGSANVWTDSSLI